jgi:hypothetical protein
LVAGGREFILILTLVLALYAMLAIRVDALPLNDKTLLQLRRWEDGVQRIHEGFERMKLTAVSAIALAVALWLLRIIDRLLTRNTNAVDVTGRWLAFALKWSQRLSLAVLAAASLTFLGTSPDGPVSRIRLQVRDATKHYEEFQHKVRVLNDLASRQELLNFAWTRMPTLLRAELRDSHDFMSARERLEVLAARASARFGIKSPPLPGPPPGAPDPKPVPPPAAAASEDVPGFLTPDAVDALKAQADETYLSPEEKTGKEDPEDALLKEALGDLSPVQRLTDRVDLLASLKFSYPVFGEFIATVSDAFTEPAFQALKELAARHVLHAKLQEWGKSLAATLREVAASTARRADLDWTSYSAAWANAMAVNLAKTKAAVEQVRVGLQREADLAQSREIAELAPRVGVKVNLFAKVADARATDALQKQAASAKEAVTRLLQDARQRPALSVLPPKDAQLVQAVLSGFVPEQPPPGRADDRLGAYAAFSRQRAMVMDTGDALAALEAINLRCSDTIVDLAGRTDSAAVRQALGADFDSYRRVWQNQKDRRDKEARREAEVEAEVLTERSAREPRRQNDRAGQSPPGRAQ